LNRIQGSHRICILVKAYPQPSKKYEETVCCAGVTEDGRLIRLYPIPYRRLDPSQQFDRFDWIEAYIQKSTSDPRPESFKVNPDTIRIVHPKAAMKGSDRVLVWKPFVADSLTVLHAEQKQVGRSLGIVRPDAGSIRFLVVPITEASTDEQELEQAMTHQMPLFAEEPLPKLRPAEYVFKYRFTSAGVQHEMQIHDWEVQAAYYSYKKRYRNEALDRLVKMYQETIPSQNVHFIMGTIQQRPWQFIIIGLLRTGVDIDAVDAQQVLF
jgi:hypothetical protein